MNNLHKVNKILIVTLLVFSVGVFGFYSKTASKYWIDDSRDNILNKTSFKSLTQEVSPTWNVIGETAQITVEFFRTASIDDDLVTKDEIEFSLTENSAKCHITNVSTSSTGLGNGFYENDGKNLYELVSDDNGIENKVRLTYTDITSNISKDTKVAITYECDANEILVTEGSSKDYLQTDYRTVETIYTENGDVINTEVFRMFGGKYNSPNKYEKPLGYEITGDRNEKLILNTANLTEAIVNEWILKYVTTNFNSVNDDNAAYDHLQNYLEFNGPSWKPESILGLNYDSTKKEYTFDDIIMSYAFTSSFAHDNRRLYFVHFDDAKLPKDVVESLFKYYYNLYYAPKYTTTENTEILNYISDNGGISSVVVDGKILEGVTYRHSYVVLDKDLIMAVLHPITPDIILDFEKYPTIEGKMIQYISTSIKDFVQNSLGVVDFDTNKVEYDIFISRYLNELNGKEGINDYYYLVVDNKLLSMRFYKDDDGNYAMHMSAFDDASVDTSATSHVFLSTEQYFMSSTNTSDYATLRVEFLRYVQAIDDTYGTSFMATAGARFDAVVHSLMNPPAGEGVGHVTMTNLSFQDSTKGYSLVLNYSPVETDTGLKYGRLAFSFTPPAEAITRQASSTTSSKSNGSGSQSTTSEAALTNAVMSGALTGAAR